MKDTSTSTSSSSSSPKPPRQYVGSTEHMLFCILGRSGHFRIIKKHRWPSTLRLRRNHRALYTYPCKPGMEVRFRVLAEPPSHDEQVAMGWRYLLESFWMTVFGTFRQSNWGAIYGTFAAWRLCIEVRELVGLPASDWDGLNAAFPICQGFYNKRSREPSLCANSPACITMTYARNDQRGPGRQR